MPTPIHRPEPMLWLSDARGQYIPLDFASCFADRSSSVSGVSDKDWATLEAGPDHEYYWDTWNKVCDSATIRDGDTDYFIYQDGHCWLIPHGMVWSDKEDFFVWPQDEESEDESDDSSI